MKKKNVIVFHFQAFSIMSSRQRQWANKTANHENFGRHHSNWKQHSFVLMLLQILYITYRRNDMVETNSGTEEKTNTIQYTHPKTMREFIWKQLPWILTRSLYSLNIICEEVSIVRPTNKSYPTEFETTITIYCLFSLQYYSNNKNHNLMRNGTCHKSCSFFLLQIMARYLRLSAFSTQKQFCSLYSISRIIFICRREAGWEKKL